MAQVIRTNSSRQRTATGHHACLLRTMPARSDTHHVVAVVLFPIAESVIVSPDGRAMMLNKFGGVFEAFEQPDGSFKLNETAKGWLGPGR